MNLPALAKRGFEEPFAALCQLLGADLHLDGTRPFILARAGTTKNKKEAIIPLHPPLAEELRSLPVKKADPVFKIGLHPERTFKRDLHRADIEPLDPLGRKLDFHSLRKTFATRLAQKGISVRLTQELMRHSDPKLTANIYTDVSQLPTFDAVTSLEWKGDTPAPDTHIASQEPVPACLAGAQTGTGNGWRKECESIENRALGQVLTPPVTQRQMVGAVRFELTTSCTPSKRASQATLRPDRIATLFRTPLLNSITFAANASSGYKATEMRWLNRK